MISPCSNSEYGSNNSEQSDPIRTSVNIEDDDGFFSDDLHMSTLSKSMIALNQFVKNNMINDEYDKSEESKKDETVQKESKIFNHETFPKLSEKKKVFSAKLFPKNNSIKPVISCKNSTINNRLSVPEEKAEIILDPTGKSDESKVRKGKGVIKANPQEQISQHVVLENEPKGQNSNIFEKPNSNGNADCNNVDEIDSRQDDSAWVNRLNEYPDVYAPLPYKSPRRHYVESDVNIHYKCPVRRDPLPHVPEKELARLQAEHMRRVYQEERRRKYLQELQDLQSRRHTDNFTPSQKTIVALNRYDDAPVTASTRTKARVLYDFASHTPRELNLKKGDIVMIRRQIDANWYEGEHSGKVGLFPYNYVEIIKTSEIKTTPIKPVHEGRARAKFDFMAQTNLELPLRKGELVVLIRKVDENWWEGRLGNKIGIFPDSYIQVLDEPTGGRTESISKPVASPASHGLMNGTARTSMGPHSYTPQLNSPALSNAPQPNQPLTTNSTSTYKAARIIERTTTKSPAPNEINNHKPLYIDTNAEPIPYRAMYKYKPQNPDELELLEGDTVYVVEKCDDGWFVGTSKRTQRFGTFPGNYVERIA